MGTKIKISQRVLIERFISTMGRNEEVEDSNWEIILFDKVDGKGNRLIKWWIKTEEKGMPKAGKGC